MTTVPDCWVFSETQFRLYCIVILFCLLICIVSSCSGSKLHFSPFYSPLVLIRPVPWNISNLWSLRQAQASKLTLLPVGVRVLRTDKTPTWGFDPFDLVGALCPSPNHGSVSVFSSTSRHVFDGLRSYDYFRFEPGAQICWTSRIKTTNYSVDKSFRGRETRGVGNS